MKLRFDRTYTGISLLPMAIYRRGRGRKTSVIEHELCTSDKSTQSASCHPNLHIWSVQLYADTTKTSSRDEPVSDTIACPHCGFQTETAPFFLARWVSIFHMTIRRPAVFSLTPHCTFLVVALAVVVILEEEMLVGAVGSESDGSDTQTGEKALETVPSAKGARITPGLTVVDQHWVSFIRHHRDSTYLRAQGSRLA